LNAYIRHTFSSEHQEQAKEAFTSIYDNICGKEKGKHRGNEHLGESVPRHQLPQTGREKQCTNSHSGRFLVENSNPKAPNSVKIDSSLKAGVEDKGVPPGLINSRDQPGPIQTGFHNKPLNQNTSVDGDIESGAEVHENSTTTAAAASLPQHPQLGLPECLGALSPFYSAEPNTLKGMGYMLNPLPAIATYTEPGTDLDAWANFDQTQPYVKSMNYMPSSNFGATAPCYGETGTDLDSWASFDQTQRYAMEKLDYMPSLNLEAKTSCYRQSGSDLDAWANFDQTQRYAMENMHYMPDPNLGAAISCYGESGTDLDSWANFEQIKPYIVEEMSSIANSNLDTVSYPHAEHLDSQTNRHRQLKTLDDSLRNSVLPS
jgi:hypothetical protein